MDNNLEEIRREIDAVDGDRLLLSKDGQHWAFEKY